MSCLICGEPELEGQEAVCRGCVSQYGRKAQARKRDRAPRNEHDTRVATAITCTECGADDRLPFVPRRKDKVLCRNCAASILDVYRAPERPWPKGRTREQLARRTLKRSTTSRSTGKLRRGLSS